MMTRRFPSYMTGASWLALLACAAFSQPDSLRWNEFKPRVIVDAGHIRNGEYQGSEMKFHPLNRTTVVLEQSAAYGDEWIVEAGFKAMLWWPFQQGGIAPYQRNMRGAASLSQVRAQRSLGALGENAFLEFGFFPYKYNPDAANLGEYLYRSGTYPGILRSTDGMNLMNHAHFDAYGIHMRMSQAGGLIAHDFNLFSEPTSVPVGDLTPAYEFSLNTRLFQAGAGAAYNRFFSYDAARNRPRVAANAYFVADSVGVDTLGNNVRWEGVLGELPNNSTVRQRITQGDPTVRAEHYFTQRGVKLMARAAVDLGFLLPEESRNPGDLRVFSEIALLGWENQPFYYEDKGRRMPVMFGVNVPTWRLLDRLAVQGEYYAARFADTKQFDENARPVWSVSPGYSPSNFKRDDWKWSVNGRRAVNRLLTVHAQVANDHIRLPVFTGNPSSTALTQTPENWYYLLRLEARL
jgi:hypothetical protein